MKTFRVHHYQNTQVNQSQNFQQLNHLHQGARENLSTLVIMQAKISKNFN